MTTPARRLYRHALAAGTIVLLAGGVVAIAFSIQGAYELGNRVDRALDALCAYQKGNKREGDRRFDFSQTLARENAKGWTAAARARRTNAVEAAAAGHVQAAREYLETADLYASIAAAITAAADDISKRPPPPCLN